MIILLLIFALTATILSYYAGIKHGEIKEAKRSDERIKKIIHDFYNT